jgi:hypothetical protein
MLLNWRRSPEDVLTDLRTLQNNGFNVDGSPYAVNVQDILIDWIDLQYHETVMTMGGDLGYRVLAENMVYDAGTTRSCSWSRAPCRTRRSRVLGR